jgi:hypothetical protein
VGFEDGALALGLGASAIDQNLSDATGE